IVFISALRDISTIIFLAGAGSQTLSLLMMQFAMSSNLEAGAGIGVITPAIVIVVALAARPLGLHGTPPAPSGAGSAFFGSVAGFLLMVSLGQQCPRGRYGNFWRHESRGPFWGFVMRPPYGRRGCHDEASRNCYCYTRFRGSSTRSRYPVQGSATAPAEVR